jgi:hypothetical protein
LSPLERIAKSDSVLQEREDADQLGADVFDRRNDRDRVSRRDELFDCRRAGLVFQETLELLQHWVPLSNELPMHGFVTESAW